EQQQQAEDEDLGIDREHGVLAARATPCRRAREVEWIPFERITANRAARTKTPRNPGVSTLKPAMVRRRPDAREGGRRGEPPRRVAARHDVAVPGRRVPE